MKVVCVIPTYNEASSLPQVISELKSVVDEIIVVDDGSADQTLELLKTLPVKFLSHAINRGQGAALRTGTIQALKDGADIIVHFDADGQFRASDIERLTQPLKNQTADIVFGSRFLDQTTKMPWFKKHIIMGLARLINRWLFNVRLSDPQSGFRAFNAKAALKLDWQQDRMAHCSEILYRAHQTDLVISEVPITVLYKNFGQRFGGGLKILKDLLIDKLNN